MIMRGSTALESANALFNCIGRVSLEKRGVNLGENFLVVVYSDDRRFAIPEPLGETLAFPPEPPLRLAVEHEESFGGDTIVDKRGLRLRLAC